MTDLLPNYLMSTGLNVVFFLKQKEEAHFFFMACNLFHSLVMETKEQIYNNSKHTVGTHSY